MMSIAKLKKIILNFPGVKRIHYHYARNKNVLGEVPFQKNHVNLNCADWSWQPNVGDYLPRVVFEYMINRGETVRKLR